MKKLFRRDRGLAQPALIVPPAAPRPLRPGEQLDLGAAVRVADDPTGVEYRLVGWQECGKTLRFALLDCGRCPAQHVALDSRLRLPA